MGFFVDTVILVTGVLLLLGIASSKFSARFGVPVLVLFLALGMLAGSEGIGGIAFENFEMAHAVGTLALAFILFDGGLSTPLGSIRKAWKPSAVLATFGVLVTSLVTGLAASWFLNIDWFQGLLLGSIVGSTDAAAVFAVLRSGGVSLSKKLSATLEIESGSNDPMAIFLTLGCIQVLTEPDGLGIGLLGLFASQMVVGGLVGVTLGLSSVWVINRINLEAAGLYPVLATAMGLLTFGLAAWLGGSGFLAVYLAGIFIGNSRLVFKRGILLFHDALAWLSQIMMFVVLGLLSSPSRLLEVAPQGLVIALVLTFLARPLAVLLSLLPFRFSWREQVIMSCGGLKGAVPITLATFPLLSEVPHAALMFDVVFFIVVISALGQGWTLPYMARWLKLELPPEPTPPVTLEISSLRHVEGDIVDYAVSDDSRACGRRVRDLALPEGVVIALIARNEKIIPPQGHTQIEAGDHVVLVLSPGTRPLVNQVFGRLPEEVDDLPHLLEFPLRASITVEKLEEFYGIKMNARPAATLEQAMRERAGGQKLEEGSMVRFGAIALNVREVDETGAVQQVGMVVLPQNDREPDVATAPAAEASPPPATDAPGPTDEA